MLTLLQFLDKIALPVLNVFFFIVWPTLLYLFIHENDFSLGTNVLIIVVGVFVVFMFSFLSPDEDSDGE